MAKINKNDLIQSLLDSKFQVNLDGKITGGAFPCGAMCSDSKGKDICNVRDWNRCN